MCSFFICVWGWGGGGEVCPCFTAENWGQTLPKLSAGIKKGDRPCLNIVLGLKRGDRPCLNLVLGLKKGQTLIKLNAWIKKGDRSCLNLVHGLKRGQTLFKLSTGIEKRDRPCLNLMLGLKKGDRPCLNLVLGLKKGTDLHLTPITAFAKKICESKKSQKKMCLFFIERSL